MVFRLPHVRKAQHSLLLPTCVLFLILLGFALMDWRNFDGDQAVGGLMARRWLQGEFTVYPWGQRYFGVLIIPIVAFCMLFFGETSIFAIRLPAVVFSCVLLLTACSFARRVWGERVALYTAWLLAVPGISVAVFLCMHVFAIYGTLGIAMLWYALQSPPQSFQGRTAKAALLGVMTGLGYWLTPSFLEYVLAMIVMLIVLQPAWGNGWARMHGSRNMPLLAAVLTAAAFTLLLAPSHQVRLAAAALVICVIFCVFAVLRLGGFSLRRFSLYAALFAAGYAIGNMPQWLHWWISGAAPEHRLEYVIPGWRSVAAMIHTLLPALSGVQPLPALSDMHPVQGGMLFMACVFTVIGFALFAAGNYPLWRRALRGETLTAAGAASCGMVLLFCVPVVSLTMRWADNVGQIRYILDAWIPLAVMTAVGWSLPARKHWCSLAVAAHVVAAGWGMYSAVGAHPANKGFRPSAISALQDLLSRYDVRGGYANYWSAFPITFLTDERIIIAPYYGSDRRPAYHEFVSGLPRFAVLVSTEHMSPYPESSEVAILPASFRTAQELSTALRQLGALDPYYSTVTKRLGHARVIARSQAGIWDVWVLEDGE